MKNRSGQKIKLASFNSLLGIQEERTEDGIVLVPVRLFHVFKNHPFQVVDDEKMQELVESIKQNGVLVPGIVRPYPEGGYEVIAGHRRWRACELAGVEEMPVIVRELNDDEAAIMMTDSNIQRENILPSEKARAYKMKYEAMKHQGSQGGKHTADEVGEAAGESGRTVQRYIRLTALIPALLDAVDKGKLSTVIGERLSYLKEEEQEWVLEATGNGGVFPGKAQAEQLKYLSEKEELTISQVYSVLVKKGRGKINVSIPENRIRKYFPDTFTKDQVEEVIYRLLEEWKKNGAGGTDG